MYGNIDLHSRRLIADFPMDRINCIEKLQSHCANMTCADKSRYDRTLQQVTRKGGESEIIYIKIFKNAHALSIFLGNSYSENQLIHTFLGKVCQGGKYSPQIASHPAELRRGEKYTDKSH